MGGGIEFCSEPLAPLPEPLASKANAAAKTVGRREGRFPS